MDVVKQEPYWGEKIPLRWLQFEEEKETLREKDESTEEESGNEDEAGKVEEAAKHKMKRMDEVEMFNLI